MHIKITLFRFIIILLLTGFLIWKKMDLIIKVYGGW